MKGRAFIAIISRPIFHFQVKCSEKLIWCFLLRLWGVGRAGITGLGLFVFAKGVSVWMHLWETAAPLFGKTNRMGFHQSKCHLYTGNTQIYISSLDVSPEPHTHTENCLPLGNPHFKHNFKMHFYSKLISFSPKPVLPAVFPIIVTASPYFQLVNPKSLSHPWLLSYSTSILCWNPKFRVHLWSNHSSPTWPLPPGPSHPHLFRDCSGLPTGFPPLSTPHPLTHPNHRHYFHTVARLTPLQCTWDEAAPLPGTLP